MKLRLLNNIDTLKSTDNATEIQLSVLDEAEEIVDLSQYANISIAIGYQGTRYSSETPVIAEDHQSLSIVLSNALPEGKYNIEVILTKEDGTYHIAPNEGIFILTIEKSLSKVGTSVTVISVQQLLDDMAEVRRLSEQSNANVTEALNNINELLETANETNAADVKVADADNNFITDNVENALAELASKVNDTIPASEKGVANGVAILNEEGKVIDADGNVVAESGGGSDVDLSEYAKTSDVNDKDAAILQSAKDYTDNHVAQVDTTNLATKQSVDDLSDHFNTYKELKVSDIELHGLRVTNGKLEFFDGTNWITLKNDTEEISDDTSNTPGATNLIAGTMEAGYFGTVTSEDFITGDALASAIGLTAGTSQNSMTDWLKFAYEGNILFVPKKPIRNNLSWNDINAADAVTGTKIITVQGVTFKVRLFKGAVTNPATGTDYGAKYSEWNRLMLPIHAQASDKSWAYPNYVESDVPNWGVGFTDVDLITHSSYGMGSYSWCQEVYDSYYRVVRGLNGVSFISIASSTNVANGFGWRPVLELVK